MLGVALCCPGVATVGFKTKYDPVRGLLDPSCPSAPLFAADWPIVRLSFIFFADFAVYLAILL